MLFAAPLQYRELWILTVGSGQCPSHRAELEREQVITCEESREVARGEDRNTFDDTHASTLRLRMPSKRRDRSCWVAYSAWQRLEV